MNMFGIVTLAAMAGALTALLFAPRKGSETRDQLRQGLRNARQTSEGALDNVKSKAQEGVDKLKQKTDETSAQAEDMITEARSQVEDTIAEAQPKTTGRRPTSSA